MALKGRKRAFALALELMPAALLNFAVAFAVATFLRSHGLGEQVAAASIGAGVIAFLFAWRVLHRLGRVQHYALPLFDTPSIHAEQAAAASAEDELLLEERCFEAGSNVVQLGETGRPAQPDTEQQDEGELLLDDIVRKFEPESRVVRLFDPAAMPTAGELSERIDRHLRSGRQTASPPDATDELHQALAELRRSLR